MNKPIKTIAVALAAIASMSVQQTEACTRATYIGPDNTVITGRTMDWKEDLMSNIYVSGLTHYSFYHKYFLCCIPNN